ncbi:hypothetical protein D3C81_1923000 [compost metagenome]
MVDRLAQQAFLDREPYLQVVHFQQRCANWIMCRQTAGLGIDQHLCVMVLRRTEQRRAIGLLDNLPTLHHANTVGNAPYQVQVMADQQ